MSKSKTFPLGRDSKSGKFVPVEKARNNPDRTVVERIPKAGFGDTKGPSKGPRPPRKN